jgi:cbb3-type cytochrome oxidase maturation protein
MELTWIAIAASLLMGAGGLLVFVWSVRAHMFTNFEDVKYQVFWSDADEATGTSPIPGTTYFKEQQHGSSTKD